MHELHICDRINSYVQICFWIFVSFVQMLESSNSYDKKCPWTILRIVVIINYELHNAVNGQRYYVCISKANLSIRINRNIVILVTLANLIFAINYYMKNDRMSVFIKVVLYLLLLHAFLHYGIEMKSLKLWKLQSLIDNCLLTFFGFVLHF